MRSCVRGEGKPLSTVDSAGQSAHAKQMGVFFFGGVAAGTSNAKTNRDRSNQSA